MTTKIRGFEMLVARKQQNKETEKLMMLPKLY